MWHNLLSVFRIFQRSKAAVIEMSALRYKHSQCSSGGIAGSMVSWASSKLRISKLKICLDRNNPSRCGIHRGQLSGKLFLSPEGAGSIGSEIVRQILPFQPHILSCWIRLNLLCTNWIKIRENTDGHNLETVIADIRQADRMRRDFDVFKPQVVFHAAAYKHVQLWNTIHRSKYSTDVPGLRFCWWPCTRIPESLEFWVVSTDKAVNPRYTNIMGATKRIAEIYCQSLSGISSTKFITTRFGNVLDSNGSVIPRFKDK